MPSTKFWITESKNQNRNFPIIYIYTDVFIHQIIKVWSLTWWLYHRMCDYIGLKNAPGWNFANSLCSSILGTFTTTGFGAWLVTLSTANFILFPWRKVILPTGNPSLRATSTGSVTVLHSHLQWFFKPVHFHPTFVWQQWHSTWFAVTVFQFGADPGFVVIGGFCCKASGVLWGEWTHQPEQQLVPKSHPLHICVHSDMYPPSHEHNTQKQFWDKERSLVKWRNRILRLLWLD